MIRLLKNIYLVVLIIFLVPLSAKVQASGEVSITYRGKEQKVIYNFYVPPLEVDQPMPVLVCVGGLQTKDDQYIHSDPRECFDERWYQFAEENQIAILGLGFLFVPEDWKRDASYQHPAAWSGKALLKILKQLSQEFPIDQKEIYLFGISAGAQFSIRFAQMKPSLAKAVAAHAGGGYDWPKRHIPTKFLITVGELDNADITRVEMAQAFEHKAKEKGIDIQLKIILDIGHIQTEEQNEMSRQFFKEALRR